MQENNSQEIDNDDLYEHHRFTASEGQEPLRVDKFLMNFIENATRNKIQQAAKAGNVLVNDIAVKSNHKVKPSDIVRVVLAYPPAENLLVAEDIPLNIIYEDDAVIVVNKSAGMVVHPGHGNYSGTLVNGLIHHIENLPSNTNERPGLVHRIDKDTSGLLVVTKTEFAMANLSKQFFDRTTKRKYYALVWGDVAEDEGKVDLYLGRSLKNRKLMVGYPDKEHGKHAVTHYKVVEKLGYVTLIECKLETGRTHQIRVHMTHMGNSIVGDDKYKKKFKQNPVKRSINLPPNITIFLGSKNEGKKNNEIMILKDNLLSLKSELSTMKINKDNEEIIFKQIQTNYNILKNQKETGVKKRLIGFELIDRGVPRQGYQVLDEEGKTIGTVTSGTMSPSLKKAIGLAYVPSQMSSIGSEIYIEVRKKRLKAKIVSLPFYKIKKNPLDFSRGFILNNRNYSAGFDSGLGNKTFLENFILPVF